jgi:hypothetical protein
MSQQGSDHHIWQELGNDLDKSREIEADAEAMAIIRTLKAKGYRGEDIRRVMNKVGK